MELIITIAEHIMPRSRPIGAPILPAFFSIFIVGRYDDSVSWAKRRFLSTIVIWYIMHVIVMKYAIIVPYAAPAVPIPHWKMKM